MSDTRINDRIRVPEVRLVGPNGEQVGIVRIETALQLAEEAGLDLVEVAPDARPPVCKLMDYGKFKYEADIKARDARRNQANTNLKEIRFRLKIDSHDYETKKGHVERFLSAGDKVKVMIMFRGREQSRPEAGMRLLQKLADEVTELGFVESAPKQDGRNMIMVLGPVRKKSDTKQATRRPRRQQRIEAAEEVTAEQTPAKAPVAEPSVTEAATPVAQAPAAPAVTEPTAKPAAAPKPAPAAKPAVAKPKPAAKPAAPKPAAKPAAAKPAAPRTKAAPKPKTTE